MMSTKIDSIKKILREEKDAFVSAVKSLKTQLVAAEEDVSRVVIALNALEQKPRKTATHRRGHSAVRNNKPCCTKQEVVSILAGLLRDNGSLTAEELDALARDNVVNERKKSLSMYANLFKKALADPQFAEVTPGMFALATENRRLQST